MLTGDFKETPYWLDGLAPISGLSADPPDTADILVIGAGYTGLHAAREAARCGRGAVVLDAGDPGAGCSTRNGGQIGASIKPSLETLARWFGLDRARKIRREGMNALDWIEAFISQEKIDCDFRRAGRFHAAHTPRHYDRLAREVEQLAKDEGVKASMTPRSEQRRELGSDLYHGGAVFPDHASLHPGNYHRGLLANTMAAGVEVVPHCEALAIQGEPERFLVQTSKGRIKARDLVIATNGYTSGLTPWLRRRVIPIGSYIIATEPLPPALIDRLFPTERVISDTCRVIYYYRTSPDRTRVLFGGRASALETDPRISAKRLHADMRRIFPDLAGTRVSHSWYGKVAYSFDELAHIGAHEGMHYAMAYCGSGVSMASYLGMRLGQRLAGESKGGTAFDGLAFPTRPLYGGWPWFLPPMVAWYRFRDRVDIRLCRA